MPDVAGIPPHIRVAHEPEVLAEFADPAVTAAVYVPRWPLEVHQVFFRLATSPHKTTGVPHHGAPVDLQSLMRLNEKCLSRGLHEHEADAPLNRQVIEAISEQQMVFAQMALRHLSGKGREPFFEADLITHTGDSSNTVLTFRPSRPERCSLHTDLYDVALFTKPVGTILVDQSGYAPQKPADTLVSLTRFAGKLWQIPDASFAFLRGHRKGTPQFHMVPFVPKGVLRYRLFVRN